MSYGRKAALIAILLGSSTIATPVLAQAIGDGEIIMRRPLPNLGGTPFVLTPLRIPIVPRVNSARPSILTSIRIPTIWRPMVGM